MSPTTTATRPYRGESITKRRSDRRRQLMKAGLRLIGEHGYAKTTVKAVCQEAQLTERYFYESFKNREQLLAEVYREQTDALQWQMIAAAEEAGDGQEQLIQATLHAFFSTLKSKPDMARLILFEIIGVSEAMNQLYYEAMDGFAELSRNLSEKAGITILPDECDEAMVHAGLIGAAVQIGRRWALNGYREPQEQIIGSAVLLFTATSRLSHPLNSVS
ncbi:TetR/AcrR family transcriptional regulator [Spongiibacter sp. KMU-158]|uniref:TetR/AcrR family transcriptional regulator n=1 Tax=Spongiibacter pelagi TaxID=2760804 RepID=A0A927BYR0_9GAMM|nr:TetR/AcrR family transcriptional regulator [Spongiibacter pelagi]MBD2858029.1 TetR/AcrR family transcriptional regulator [Spongiibacter pelagi]